MQPVRWGRVAGAVVAVCAAGMLSIREVRAMVLSPQWYTAADGSLWPTETRLNLAELGITSLMDTPYTAPGAVGGRPQQCAWDDATRELQCGSHAADRDAAHGEAIEITTRDGQRLHEFDASTAQRAIVRRAATASFIVPSTGRPSDFVMRSTRVFHNIGAHSAERVLDGADTTFTVEHHTNGTVTSRSDIVTLSKVRVPASHAAGLFPTAGVLHASMATRFLSTAPHESNLIVYFDGTPTPVVYLDGQRYRVDLQTGLATAAPTR